MPKDSTKETEPKKRAPRKRTPEVSAPKESNETVRKALRKAPTTISNSTPVTKKSKKALYIVGSIVVISFASAVFIGNSDKGEINITAVMNERNAKLTNQNNGNQADSVEGEASTEMIVPVQNRQAVNQGGGLVPSSPEDLAEATKQPVIEETETASSTASSTESMEEEEAPEVIDETEPNEEPADTDV